MMRPLMGDGADQRRLPVGPAHPADTRPCRAGRVLPVGGEKHRGRQLPPVIERHAHARSARLMARHPHPVQRLYAFLRVDGGEKGAAQETILEHVAHRPLVDLGVIELEHEGREIALARAPVRHLDLENRLGIGRHLRPHADRRQKPLGGERHRIAPPVEALLGKRRAAQRIDKRHPQPALGQRQGKSRAVEPAAHDDRVAIRHALTYGAAGRIVHIPPRRYRPRRQDQGGRDVAGMAGDTGSGAWPGHRGRPHRPGGAHRNLPRRHRGPSAEPAHLCPPHARARPRRGRRRPRARPRRPAPRSARRGAGELEGSLRHRRGGHRGRLGTACRPRARARCPRGAQRHLRRDRLPRQDASLRACLLRPRPQPGDRDTPRPP